MLKVGYHFIFDFYKSDGTPLGRVPASIDWEPALEWIRFERVRRDRLDACLILPGVSVEPVWNSEQGRPYVGGFRMTVDGVSGAAASIDFPAAYFRPAARKAATAFIESGELAEGDLYLFRTTAFARDVEPQQVHPPTIEIDMGDIEESWQILDRDLNDLKLASEPAGSSHPIDAPVFVPNHVLEEAKTLSRDVGAVETGGVLIGHLCLDPTSREIFVEVTTHVPARHTQAEMTRLTFTAATWTDVRNAIHLRRKDEVMLGWWHSHIGREVCRNCGPEAQRVCRFSQGFLSAHDMHLHRTAFPRASNVALVVNDSADGAVTFSLFGWRWGLLERRGFYISGIARHSIPISGRSNSLPYGDDIHVATDNQAG